MAACRYETLEVVMTIKITYFAHWTTIDNDRQISSGWFDVELSELGVRQSIELKDQVKDEIFDVVFCSDVRRVAHSASMLNRLALSSQCK